jgi:hypothetical protein
LSRLLSFLPSFLPLFRLENHTSLALDVMGGNTLWGNPVVLGTINSHSSLIVAMAYSDVSDIRFRPKVLTEYGVPK